jgi:hypothetical protein
MTVLTAVLIALVTGLLGALISTWIYIRRDRRMFKVQTLKKFAAHRYDITGDVFSEAVNEIFVVFNDSEEVLRALESFHELVVNGIGGKERKDALVKLFKAMCSDTKIKYKDLNDSLFLTPFNARHGE